MIVEIFTFCEEVTFDETKGLLSIQNAFDASRQTVPVVIGKLWVGGRLRFEYSEAGEHKLLVRLVDPESTLIASGGASFIIKPSEHHSTTIPVVIDFSNGLFKSLGRYAAILALDGLDVHSTPLFIKKPLTLS